MNELNSAHSCLLSSLELLAEYLMHPLLLRNNEKQVRLRTSSRARAMIKTATNRKKKILLCGLDVLSELSGTVQSHLPLRSMHDGSK